jgi:biopolymer transport protein ExbD
VNWDMLQKSVPVAVFFLVLILLVAFHALPPKHSTGFFVGLAPARCTEDVSDRLIVLRIAEGSTPFINSEQEQWNTLASDLSEIYSGRVYRTLYLSAEDGVPFQTVADAIDIVENTRFSAPTKHRMEGENFAIAVKLVTPAAINAPCPQPTVISSSRHTPR